MWQTRSVKRSSKSLNISISTLCIFSLLVMSACSTSGDIDSPDELTGADKYIYEHMEAVNNYLYLGCEGLLPPFDPDLINSCEEKIDEVKLFDAVSFDYLKGFMNRSLQTDDVVAPLIVNYLRATSPWIKSMDESLVVLRSCEASWDNAIRYSSCIFDAGVMDKYDEWVYNSEVFEFAWRELQNCGRSEDCPIDLYFES